MKKSAKELREYALSFPEVTEDFPWGERVAKVAKKVFVFLGRDDGDPKKTNAGESYVGVKLPESRHVALKKKYASPMEYGLGLRGWVSLRFAPREELPIDQLKEWIEESYRAIAPKRAIKALDLSRAASAAPTRGTRAKAPRRAK
jgi:predicted DNA-binding protein (MmcQ/YjbR family)